MTPATPATDRYERSSGRLYVAAAAACLIAAAALFLGRVHLPAPAPPETLDQRITRACEAHEPADVTGCRIRLLSRVALRQADDAERAAASDAGVP